MKLKEAVGRLRTSASREIDQRTAALKNCSPGSKKWNDHRRRIRDLQEAREAAADFIEIIRDRDWTGKRPLEDQVEKIKGN